MPFLGGGGEGVDVAHGGSFLFDPALLTLLKNTIPKNQINPDFSYVFQ